MSNNEIQIATLTEKLDSLREMFVRMESSIKDIKTKLDEKYVTKEQHENLIHRVDAMEDNTRWIVRAVIGQLLAAGLGLLLYFQK